MHATNRRLLAAHVKFEMGQWSDDQLGNRISEESTAILDWLEKTPLEALSSADAICRLASRVLQEVQLDDEGLQRVSEVVRHLIALPINDDTMLGDLIDDELFHAGIDLSLELRHLRDALLAEALGSPIYKRLVTEILYNGIRDYLIGEGSVTQKMAGMSGIIGKSAKSIGKRLSALDEKVEGRIRSYVEKNATANVDNSREFLERTLTDERVRELASMIWSDLRRSPLSINEVLQDGDVEAIAQFLRRAWQDLRATAYVEELVREAVTDAFRNWGGQDVATLLYSTGIQRTQLQEMLQDVVPSVITAARDSGLLETFLERRLRAFYESPECWEAINEQA